jgi:hypothetical protein
MVKAVTDSHIKAKNEAHARAINGDRTIGHRMVTHMRDSVTGYGECENTGCHASYNVGYRVRVSDDPIITDDTAANTRCPYVPASIPSIPVDSGKGRDSLSMPGLDDPHM